MTTLEIARRLALSPRTLQHWVSTGLIPAAPDGQRGRRSQWSPVATHAALWAARLRRVGIPLQRIRAILRGEVRGVGLNTLVRDELTGKPLPRTYAQVRLPAELADIVTGMPIRPDWVVIGDGGGFIVSFPLDDDLAHLGQAKLPLTDHPVEE